MNTIRRILATLAGGLLALTAVTAALATPRPGEPAGTLASAAARLVQAPAAARPHPRRRHRRDIRLADHPDRSHGRPAHRCAGSDRLPDAGHAAARDRQPRMTRDHT
jgi:hypothetical protein